MEKIAMAELNLHEVLYINRENALAALDRSGGRMLFVTEEEFEDRHRCTTEDYELLLLDVDNGDGPFPGFIVAAEAYEGMVSIIIEDMYNHGWYYNHPSALNDYELNMVYCEIIIRKYNDGLGSDGA